MHQEFVMGNEAIALGALAAGVNVAAGYPGTPSTEVLETVARRNPGNVYVEWSVNEKAAMEVAAGAAYAGARTLMTCKQVGLNVASDPLMSLEYVGIKGGMVVVVADDPGPISSQTEQDTRTFGMFSKIPVFDPCGVADAYHMVQDAFNLSEEFGTPVILRPTTRVDHAYEAIEVADEAEYVVHTPAGWQRDPSRWVIFPKLSYNSHRAIEKRNAELSQRFSHYDKNWIQPEDAGVRRGVATHGANVGYVDEALATLASRTDGNFARPRVMRVATPFPFPEEQALEFLQGLDEVLCVEELDPVIERALIYLCGKHGIDVRICGKLTGDIPASGENTVDSVAVTLAGFLDIPVSTPASTPAAPSLPVRPPVLCAGCPHRASFYAVKRAMRGKKAVFCGDIGCYTLANAMPLDMCDTCLCMGAGITIAQGLKHIEPDVSAFAFVGDSTFFASGITGVINAFYNQVEMTLVVLDNSTTAMTGHQPHPGTGRTAMGQVVEKVDIACVLQAIGLDVVETVNPLDMAAAIDTVKRVAATPGVKAIIFKSPCVALEKREAKSQVDPAVCIGCQRCVRELGCPALVPQDDGSVAIDVVQCTGCTLCEQLCPTGAISGGVRP